MTSDLEQQVAALQRELAALKAENERLEGLRDEWARAIRARATNAENELRLTDAMRQRNLDAAAVAVQRAEKAEAELAEARAAIGLLADDGDVNDLMRPVVAERDALRAALKTASESADRFRDVLSEALGHPDENPGDDALVAELRRHFGKTGPEPTRWRDFLIGARAQVDQINAAALDAPHRPEDARGEG